MATVQSIADHLLGRPVADFIAEQRAKGRTWPQVRDDINAATGGVVTVTRQAVQQWAPADITRIERTSQIEPTRTARPLRSA